MSVQQMLRTNENARKTLENRPCSYLQGAYRGAPDPTSEVEVNLMSCNNAGQNGRGAADGMAQLEWRMRFLDGVETVWLWRIQGAPPLHQLASIRTPRSSAGSRHIPVTAYTLTNSGVVHLESGLEHDLVRMLDRDSTVVRIVSQPFQLSWQPEEPVTHFPDLLTRRIDGSVTVWDARPQEGQDDDFQAKSIVTRRACEQVGWRYTVFAGTTVTERMNTLWIHGFRRKPPWATHFPWVSG